MPRPSSNVEPVAAALDQAARLRAAVAEHHEALLRSVAVLIARTGQPVRGPDVREIAAEVLHEAVREALSHARSFDPTRSPTAWVRGIAARLLLARRRTEARGRRCVPATVLGAEAWTAALEQLCVGSADTAVAGRLDLEQALGCLAPAQRRALECRYYLGLDGEELASALEVATPGAARVRVCRALQALRAHICSAEGEMLP
jgi:RNA polymerase sigma factor (sigma-70 family)